MACCILTAVIMNRLIKACDAFDLQFLHIRYNDDEDSCAPIQTEKPTTLGTCRISIGGMTCGACVSSITKELEDIGGVFRANVSLALGRASVSFEPESVNPDQLLNAIKDAGYDANLGERTSEETIQRLRQSHELECLRIAISSASICATIILTLEYMTLWLSKKEPSGPIWVIVKMTLLFLAFKAQLWDAWSIHAQAWFRKRKHVATMETLLSLSLLLSLCLSLLNSVLKVSSSAFRYASSGSFLTVVILAGKYLEAVLRRESNSNLAALYELQAEKELYTFAQKNVSTKSILPYNY